MPSLTTASERPESKNVRTGLLVPATGKNKNIGLPLQFLDSSNLQIALQAVSEHPPRGDFAGTVET